MTGEDLECKPDATQKAKFEDSLLGKVFNKGLDESDKKEGILKRLNNIEGKNEQEFLAIKDQGEKQLDVIRDQGLSMMFKDEKNRVKNKSIFETIVEVSRNNNAKKETKKLKRLTKKLIMVIVIIGSLRVVVLTLATIWIQNCLLEEFLTIFDNVQMLF